MSQKSTNVKDIPGFFVYAIGRGYPSKVHKSKWDAMQEAARLSHELPGHRFHVMASCGWHENPIPVRSGFTELDSATLDDEIPF
jgi:hypothetical protein